MKTKRDFEKAAASVRALPMKERRGRALVFARDFKAENSKFDTNRFFDACMVEIPASHANAFFEQKFIEMDLREVEFTIYYRWNKCDVDAALVPHLSLCCGRVEHEVGKADLLGGGYDAGIAELTPYDDDVVGIAHGWAQRTKWPKGVEPCGGYPNFIQGYCDAIFKYEGNLNKLEAVISECKEILAKLIEKHVRYHVKGDKVKNRLVNVYRGTGSNIQRVE